jgi:hypothetical protein
MTPKVGGSFDHAQGEILFRDRAQYCAMVEYFCSKKMHPLIVHDDRYEQAVA